MDEQLRQIHINKAFGSTLLFDSPSFLGSSLWTFTLQKQVINPIPTVDASRYQQSELSHVNVMMMMNSNRHSVGLSSPADQQHMELHAFATQC